MADLNPVSGQGAPEVGTVVNGYRFEGGNHRDRARWTQIERVDVSGEYGPGAFRFPNGTLVRIGPKGGVEQIQPRESGTAGAPTDIKEFQANAAARATLMDQGLRDYESAVRDGYDPTSMRNGIARNVEGVPLLGVPLSNLIRDKAADRGRAAELQFVDGALRTTSGANAPEPEMVRADRAYFRAPGESADVEAGKAQLRDRFRSQAVRIAGGAYIPPAEDEARAAAVGPMQDGLPTYPGISALAAGISDGGPGTSTGPSGPGFSPDDPLDLGSLGPEDLLKLQAGQYVRRVDGTVYALPSAPFAAPQQPGDVREGNAVVRPQDPMLGYDTALEQERANADRLAPLGGGVSMSSQTTAPFNDELAYAAGYLTQGAGNIGRRLAGRDVEVSAAARGRAAQTVYQQDQATYAKEHPGRNAFAQVAGSAAIGSGGPSTMLTRIVGGGGVGTAFGASSGDSWGERGRNALVGGGVGAAASPVAERIIAPIAGRAIGAGVNAFQDVGRFASRQAGRAGEALGVPGAAALVERAQPNVLAQSVNRFASRAPQDVNALRSNVDRFRAQGIEPTFADAVNDGGRGVMRATATRQTPARQAAREFADNRATGLQDRVSSQARRHISDDPRSPMEMTAEMTAKRSREADAAFGGVRGDLISPDRGVLEALRTPAMRPAIEEAMTSALNRGDQETAGLLRNLTDDALEYGADAQITVGMADRISRSLNGRAEALQRAGNNDAAAAQFALAERLRGSARGQSPGYDTALRQFADESGKIDAVALGEGFMTMEADQFAAAVAQLAPEERAVAQAAARRAVERQAGTQGNAPGVAQRLSGGREQGMRSAALVDDPQALQTAMATEREALRNAQAVNPSAGSQTSMNAQDAMNAAGVLGGARDVMTGNVGGVLGRIANGIKSRGFNDQQAEAIVSAAINPTRTDELINMLAQSMNRREARNLARTIRYQLTTAGGQSRSTN